MAKNLKNILVDGWANTLGGVDTSRAPTLLQPNELSFAVNCVTRGGYVETRPPFARRHLTFQSDEVEDWFDNGKPLQEAAIYNPPDQNTLIVAQVGGRLFAIDVLDDAEVREITPTKSTTTTASFTSPPVGSNVTITVASVDGIEAAYPVFIGSGRYQIVSTANLNVTLTNQTADAGINIASGTPVVWLDRNPSDRPLAWMEQAEEYLITQNGSDEAIIFDGAKARRADPAQSEVPTGTAMVYNEEIGRLCVCTKGNEIAIGDIVGGPSGVLKFTENTYLNEGGKFRIPRKFGEVTAMTMMANMDRSNGQGAMLAFAERGISAFNLPATRESWKSLTYPPQVNMPIRYGAVSQSSVATVNGDIFYRSRDGLRTFVMAVREFGKWGNVPISSEMHRVLSKDDQKLLRHCSAVLFDNRLLFTCSPRPSSYGTYHGGIVALDFDRISRLGQSERPAWDCMWTGVNFIKLLAGEFAGEERCFAFVRHSSGRLELWEIKRDGDFDGDGGRIKWWFETRAMNFGTPDDLKEIAGMEIWVDRVVGELDLDVKFRPDEHPCWADWGTKSLCVTNKDCASDDNGECRTVSTYKPGFRTRLGLGEPPDTCEEMDNKPMRLGYNFQVRVQGTGKARIKRGIVKARVRPEENIATCD